MTLAEFERQYGDVKPNHECWFGEAVSKASGTWSHGLLQKIIIMALDKGVTSRHRRSNSRSVPTLSQCRM